MRTNILRSVALSLGICLSGVAHAQYGGYPTGPAGPSHGFPNQGQQATNYQIPNQQPGANQLQQAWQPPASNPPSSAYHSVPVHPSLRSLPPTNRSNAGQASVGYSPVGQSTQYTNNYPGTAQVGQPIASQSRNGFQQPAPQPVAGQQIQFPFQTVSNGGATGPGGGQLQQTMPQMMQQQAPMQMQAPVQQHAPMQMQAPMQQSPLHNHNGHNHALHGQPAGDCQACNAGNIYEQAAGAPWMGSTSLESCGPAPVFSTVAPVRNWFAGSSILFLDFEQDYNRRLVFPDAMPSDTNLQTNQVDPGASTGFETFIGRYFGNGKYAVTGSYFFLNPGRETASVATPVANGYRAAMRNWDRMYIDRDGDGMPDDVGAVGPADDHLYGVFDAAAHYRVRRDVEFQGLELNFVSFGIGGAGRVSCGSACGSGCGAHGACGGGCGGGCGGAGCGGLGGPLLPACNSRVQLQVSHGIRWFRFSDEFEFAASMTDAVYGTGIDDYYYNIDVENDLLGYQFGSLVNYCLTPRINLYAGGKFGIYGNNVDYNSRIGTAGAAAQVNGFYPAMQNQRVNVSRSETVMSTLGELDLGVGFRLTNCWTLTGGYRLLGITGVATSVGSISEDPAHLAQGHLNWLDDSILLHGGYVGVRYNW